MALDWSPVLRSEQVDVCTLLGGWALSRILQQDLVLISLGGVNEARTGRPKRLGRSVRQCGKAFYEARMATKHAVVLNGSD